MIIKQCRLLIHVNETNHPTKGLNIKGWNMVKALVVIVTGLETCQIGFSKIVFVTIHIIPTELFFPGVGA